MEWILFIWIVSYLFIEVSWFSLYNEFYNLANKVMDLTLAPIARLYLFFYKLEKGLTNEY